MSKSMNKASQTNERSDDTIDLESNFEPKNNLNEAIYS